MHLLVTTTLNANQLRAHLLPIVALPTVRSLTLVTDVPPPAMEKVTAIVPPRLLVRVAGRAAAKLAVCLWTAWRRRPNWVVGLFLVPHGLTAILVGRVVGLRSLYVMIGGPREWEGGGWRSDNRLLGRSSRPLPTVERLLLAAIRRADLVVTMGEAGRRRLVAEAVASERVVAIPAGIDTGRFRPRPGATRTYDLVNVGKLLPNKRTRDVLVAVALLHRRGRPVRAVVAGEGVLRRRLDELAEELGVSEHVDFVGFREDVESLYAAARVFVLPSASEGLSVAMMEAMATGLPVVVSDVGEARDVVADGDNGFLFGVADVEVMVDRLERLLGDDALYGRLSARAVATARAHAGYDRIGSLYAEALGRPSPIADSSEAS